MYRLSKYQALKLLDLIKDKIIFKRRTAIPLHLQVLIALNFYATGTYQRNLGDNFQHSVSQPTVSRITKRISKAISELSAFSISFPNTEERCKKISEK